MSDYISVSRSEEVARVRIDRADRHNSLIPPLLAECLEAIDSLAESDTVDVIILETAGQTFSTGGDVRAFYEHRDAIAEYADRTVGLLNEVILALFHAPQTVIAAVDGQVTGGSLGFLLASDIVLMNETATITPYYPVVGFSPDGGWTALLPAVIGRKRAQFVLATNVTIAPEEAVSWGLATELVTDQSVADRATELAHEMTRLKRGTIRRTKQLLRPDGDEVANNLAAERKQFVEQIQTAEAVDAMETFLSE